jgi:hypothetical protein
MADFDLAEAVQRARALYTTPHAVEILIAIQDGRPPSRATPANADPHAISQAICLLQRLGLINHTDANTEAPTSITTTGEELAIAIAHLDEVDRMLLTTPYAAEVLLGLQHGLQPAQAVPTEAEPQAVAEAVQLLQQLELIHTTNPTASRATRSDSTSPGNHACTHRRRRLPPEP